MAVMHNNVVTWGTERVVTGAWNLAEITYFRNMYLPGRYASRMVKRINWSHTLSA